VGDLTRDGREHLGRRRAAADERRHPLQGCLFLREDRVPLAQPLLRPAALLDVGERHDRTPALGNLDRHRDVGHREHRPVAAEEPVEPARDPLPRRARHEHRALGRRVRAAVGVLVVDRRMAVAPEQLVRAVVAERRERGGVRDRMGRRDPPPRSAARRSGARRRGSPRHRPSSRPDRSRSRTSQAPGRSSLAPPRVEVKADPGRRAGPMGTSHRRA
jgi:hypothetical protein